MRGQGCRTDAQGPCSHIAQACTHSCGNKLFVSHFSIYFYPTMRDQELTAKILYSSLAASVAPLIYGVCISSVGILYHSIEATHGGMATEVYRTLNLLLFAGAFVSNIIVANIRSKRIVRLIHVANCLFTAGFCMHFSSNYVHLYAGRFAIGLGTGVVANMVPCYLSFIAPVRHRGAVVSLYGIAIITGIILGYLFCLYSVPLKAFASSMIFLSMLQSLLLRFSQRVGPISDKASISFMSFVLDPHALRSLILITLYHVSQHLSGINHILLNAPSIFPGNDATETLIYLCLLALCTSVASSSLLDRFGRKPLTVASCVAISASCIAFYYAYHPKIFAVLFILGYNTAIAGIPFVLIGEVFPRETVGHGALFATSCNWLGALASVFVLVGDSKKYNGAFLVYVGYLAFFGLVVMMGYKETKGKMPMYQ